MGKAIGLPGGGVGYVKSHSSWAAHPGEVWQSRANWPPQGLCCHLKWQLCLENIPFPYKEDLLPFSSDLSTFLPWCSKSSFYHLGLLTEAE